jgi:hypothetical protein
MKMPGFTAQSSLGRTEALYKASGLLNQANPVVCPARLLFTDPQFSRLSLFQRFIFEPTCVRICLSHWGGHCRWICF